MAPGQPRLDVDLAEPETFAFLNLLSAGNRFARGNENGCARFFTQPRQVRDMIGMRVGEQNQFHAQAFLCRQPQHIATVRAGIERGRMLCFRIPHQIGIHGHSAVIRAELRQAVEIFQLVGFPFARAKIDKRICIEI